MAGTFTLLVRESRHAPSSAVSPRAPADEFKDNCNLVILDFMMRRGYLTPDMPGYLELLSSLRAGDCS